VPVLRIEFTGTIFLRVMEDIPGRLKKA